jgi:hypothetical protein
MTALWKRAPWWNIALIIFGSWSCYEIEQIEYNHCIMGSCNVGTQFNSGTFNFTLIYSHGTWSISNVGKAVDANERYLYIVSYELNIDCRFGSSEVFCFWVHKNIEFRAVHFGARARKVLKTAFKFRMGQHEVLSPLQTITLKLGCFFDTLSVPTLAAFSNLDTNHCCL